MAITEIDQKIQDLRFQLKQQADAGGWYLRVEGQEPPLTSIRKQVATLVQAALTNPNHPLMTKVAQFKAFLTKERLSIELLLIPKPTTSTPVRLFWKPALLLFLLAMNDFDRAFEHLKISGDAIGKGTVAGEQSVSRWNVGQWNEYLGAALDDLICPVEPAEWTFDGTLLIRRGKGECQLTGESAILLGLFMEPLRKSALSSELQEAGIHNASTAKSRMQKKIKAELGDLPFKLKSDAQGGYLKVAP